MPSSRSLLLASAFVLGAASAHAVMIDFNANGDFANNFHAYPVTDGTYAQSAGTGVLTWTTTGAQTGAFVYDTNGSAAGGVANFIPGVGNSIVVEFDFRTSVANSSVGVFFGGPRGAEHLALFNINNSGNNDQLRIFGVRNWNLTTPATNGTTSSPAANLVTGTDTNGWTINNTYHAKFTMTYTSATTVNVSYVISDPTNTLSPISISATSVTVSDIANEIGFRTGMSNTGGVITIDNISITTVIPEPSAFAGLVGLATLGFAATRRRRA